MPVPLDEFGREYSHLQYPSSYEFIFRTADGSQFAPEAGDWQCACGLICTEDHHCCPDCYPEEYSDEDEEYPEWM